MSETCSTTTAYVGGWVVERSGNETKNGEFSGGANPDPIPPLKNCARSATRRRVQGKKHQTQFSRARGPRAKAKYTYIDSFDRARASLISRSISIGTTTLLKGIKATGMSFQCPTTFGIVTINQMNATFAMDASKCPRARSQPKVKSQRTLRSPLAFSSVPASECSEAFPRASECLRMSAFVTTALPKGHAEYRASRNSGTKAGKKITAPSA